METQILSRNYQPPPPLKDRLTDRVKSIYARVAPVWLKLRSGKFITIAILLASFLLLISAIGLLSQTRKERPVDEPEIMSKLQVPSPSPVSNDMTQKVEQYSKKIDDSSPFDKKFPKPIVDLDINLEKR